LKYQTKPDLLKNQTKPDLLTLALANQTEPDLLTLALTNQTEPEWIKVTTKGLPRHFPQEGSVCIGSALYFPAYTYPG
ncbi:unnamed protein product, partial [Brassica oleracea var. botrytis]